MSEAQRRAERLIMAQALAEQKRRRMSRPPLLDVYGIMLNAVMATNDMNLRDLESLHGLLAEHAKNRSLPPFYSDMIVAIAGKIDDRIKALQVITHQLDKEIN
jgi:hypothetical protein